MGGAAVLAASAAMRSGAGMVVRSTPGLHAGDLPAEPIEAVSRSLPAAGWGDDVLDDLERFGALVIGPGLGRDAAVAEASRALLAASPIPVVVDGDGLSAIVGERVLVGGRSVGTVLTPHDGEYARLAGQPIGTDRLRAASDLAHSYGCVVLLKGATTIVADPGGDARFVTNGDDRLATAGTGDVLSGVVGALLAQGLSAFDAAAAGAWLHADAAARTHRRGMVAGDLLDSLPDALAAL
jgi:NAD(P)H-hydrate epimerase